MDEKVQRMVVNPREDISHYFHVVFCHGLDENEHEDILPDTVTSITSLSPTEYNIKMYEEDVKEVIESDRVVTVVYIEPYN